MKVLLQLLLAAPAVMGRACRARPRTTTTIVKLPASTQEHTVGFSSTFVAQPTQPVTPIVSEGTPDDSPSSVKSIVVSSSVPEAPTSFVTSAIPAATSAASESDSGSDSGSGSGSGSGSSSGSTELDSRVISGSSTWYGGNLSGGTCSFTTYSLPAGIYGTAFSGQVWNGAANCGACIEVTGPKGTIKAMVVDQCPECNEGHLDLFPDAFTAVGGTDGIVQTSYKFVTCGITSPISLHNKSGTSQWWFSMQVVNANEPVKSLEVSVDGGKTWKQTTRRDYNFFEESSGFGTQSVDVKVTSTTGKTITVKNVSVQSDSEHKASSNF